MMKNTLSIFNFYFNIYGIFADKKENIVLIDAQRIEKSEILFNPNNEIFNTKINEIDCNFDVYLSVFDDKLISLLLNCKNCLKIFLPSLKNEYKNQKLHTSDLFSKNYNEATPIRTFYDLLANNQYFEEFCDEYIHSRKTSYIIRELLNYKIISFDGNNKISFTKVGELLFSTKSIYKRKIDVSFITRKNDVEYVVDKSFDGPLFASLINISKYIYDNIQTIQIRKSLQSTEKKLFNLKTIQKLLSLACSEHQFDLEQPIKISISNTIIVADIYNRNSQYKQDELLIKRLFFKFLNIINIDDEINLKFGRKRKLDKVSFFVSYVSNSDLMLSLDSVDFEIIEYAKKVRKFTRREIDNKLNISSRNSNKRINNLVDKNILGKEGTGKATVYFIV